ncbi:hypothetical protein GCM10011316_22380 [Roseibium aquae]|uniref:diguanylate cyclase n=1 Tax=Roseibium aquae TaxID=1323746 RepID=A0A916TKQ0_9HYPH|nr:sensor domain-containing diguanylate cyclase [Roseibium aquae]GGB49790.1 hypothetical protein GCM10011316_22380 [Roseibium aquae]
MPVSITANDLQRLEAYEAAVRQMRTGQFGAVPVPGNIADPIDAFGSELAQLGNWLEARFDEFRKFQELSLEIGSELFAENVLERIYQTFHKLIPYDRIGCALLEDNGGKLRAFWAKADYRDLRISKNYSARMAGSSLEKILQTGQPRILNDLEAHLAQNPHSKATRIVVAEGINSSLTCPLIANGKPLGFLFFSSREKNTYRDLHHETFLQIAGQVSVIIEKSLLYQQLYDLNGQLVEAHKKLKDQAMHDGLTGILNRSAIMELLEAELSKARRKDHGVAVIMADIDHFKSVNDTHGHLGGDAVLREVAGRIKHTLRGYDHLGRYGGEEFLVFLSDANETVVLEVAERVRIAVGSVTVHHEGQIIRTSLSQGVALFNGSEVAEHLIARADSALYTAKKEGRNCVRFAGLT